MDYSPSIGALYLRLAPGDVAETVEIGDDVYPDVYADLDAEGRPVGVEVLDAAAFFPFLARHARTADGSVSVELPDGLVAVVLDRARIPAA
jgi:uncharacterized protein YuzE